MSNQQIDKEALKLYMRYKFLNHTEIFVIRSHMYRVKDVANKIRNRTSRRGKEPCYACGKYQEITHLHHIDPIEFLAIVSYLYPALFPLGDAKLPVSTVWLCPNHHALYHLMTDGASIKVTARIEELHESFGYDAIMKILEILEMSNYDEIVSMVQNYKRSFASKSALT